MRFLVAIVDGHLIMEYSPTSADFSPLEYWLLDAWQRKVNDLKMPTNTPTQLRAAIIAAHCWVFTPEGGAENRRQLPRWPIAEAASVSPTHSCFSPDGPLSFDLFSQIPVEKYQRNNVRRFQLFKSFTGWSTSVSSDRNLPRSQSFRGVVDLHFAESVNESVVDLLVDAVG